MKAWVKFRLVMTQSPLRLSPGREECCEPSRSPGLPEGLANRLVEVADGYSCGLTLPLSGRLFVLGTVAVMSLLWRLKLDLTKEQHVSIWAPSLRCLRLFLWILPSKADITSLLGNMKHKTSFLLLFWFGSQRFCLWAATRHPKHFITSWRNF